MKVRLCNREEEISIQDIDLLKKCRGKERREALALMLRAEGKTLQKTGNILGVSRTMASVLISHGWQLLGTKKRLATMSKELLPVHDAFSTRTANSLAFAGIETVAQARAKSDSELLRLRNLGAKCIKEIRAF